MAPSQRELEEELDVYVEGEAWPAEDDAGEPIPPGTQEEASRILRRVHRYQRDIANVHAVADADVSRINAWRGDRVAGLERQIAWARRALESFTRSALRGKTRGKVINLPDGKLKLTAPQWRVDVTDEQAFMAWALGPVLDEEGKPRFSDAVPHPDLVRVHVEPSRSALRSLAAKGEVLDADAGLVADVVTEDGEMVPGVRFVKDPEDRFDLVAAESDQ